MVAGHLVDHKTISIIPLALDDSSHVVDLMKPIRKTRLGGIKVCDDVQYGCCPY